MDKNSVYKKLCELNAEVIPAKKVSLYNIVFPLWSDLGMISDMLTQTVKVKEQPSGQHYDETKYRIILRVYNGKVYNSDGKLDVYCWSEDDFTSKSKKVKIIGVNSPMGLINLSEVINSVTDITDKLCLADLFSRFRKDLLYIESEEEQRKVVEVTEDLYNKGITECIDSWQEPEADGTYKVTKIEIGDFLILNEDAEMLYRIERDAFLATHEI